MMTRLLPLSPQPSVDEYPVTVLANTAYASGLRRMVLQFERGLGHGQHHQPTPGQFFMLDVQDTERGFRFRRPFSLYQWDDATQTGELIYKVVGQGTEWMSRWKAGDTSVVLSSLGVGVPEVFNAEPGSVLLMGGGVGIAPLALWAQSLQLDVTSQASPTLVFGVRNHQEAEPLQQELTALCSQGAFHLCTDDGSAGWHGNPAQWLEHHSPQFTHVRHVFICGPNRMMQACVMGVERLLPQAVVYVSLENHMPCGTGACYGCVVASTSEQALPLKVCEAGPVLSANALQWNAHGPETYQLNLATDAYPALASSEGTPSS